MEVMLFKIKSLRCKLDCEFYDIGVNRTILIGVMSTLLYFAIIIILIFQTFL